MKLVIPVTPLSANEMYIKGRTYSEKYKMYIQLIAYQVGQAVETYDVPISIRVVMAVKNNRTRDLDNIFKPLFDTLQNLYYFENDNLVDEIVGQKIKSTSNILYIEIKPIKNRKNWLHKIKEYLKTF